MGFKTAITIFWTVLALFYILLAKRTYNWYSRTKSLQENSDNEFLLTSKGIAVSDDEDIDGIRVSEFFKQISKTDLLGFIFAAFAAFLTGLTLVL